MTIDDTPLSNPQAASAEEASAQSTHERSAASPVETPPFVSPNQTEDAAAASPPAPESGAAASQIPAPDSTEQALEVLAASAVDESAAAASLSPESTALELNGERPRGRPFAPGQSGNALGRPRGSRNRATQVAEALIHGKGEALVEKALEMALAGDAGLLRALLTTLVPRRPHRTVEVALPEIKTAADAVAASSALLAACGRGDISPAEASEIMALITTHVRIVDVAVLAQRIAALEEQQQK